MWSSYLKALFACCYQNNALTSCLTPFFHNVICCAIVLVENFLRTVGKTFREGSLITESKILLEVSSLPFWQTFGAQRKPHHLLAKHLFTSKTLAFFLCFHLLQEGNGNGCELLPVRGRTVWCRFGMLWHMSPALCFHIAFNIPFLSVKRSFGVWLYIFLRRQSSASRKSFVCVGFYYWKN